MSGGPAIVGALASVLGALTLAVAGSPQPLAPSCAGVTHVGVLAALQGPERPAGAAWVRGIRAGLGGLPCVRLDVADASQPWGQTTSKAVQLTFANHALALLAPNGEVTHLCELLAAKLGVPVISVASDDTVTSAHLSWIFRVAPSDRQQAQLLAHAAYRAWRIPPDRVVLVTANDHDGRQGRKAFLAAAHALGVRAPRVLIAGGDAAAAGGIRGAQAVVFWTGPAQTEAMLRHWRHAGAPAALLSWKSAGLLAAVAGNGGRGAGRAQPASESTPPGGRSAAAASFPSRRWSRRRSGAPRVHRTQRAFRPLRPRHPELVGVQPCRAASARRGQPLLWQEADAAALLLAREIRAGGDRRRRLRDRLHAIRRGRARLFETSGASRACFYLAPLRLLPPHNREERR